MTKTMSDRSYPRIVFDSPIRYAATTCDDISGFCCSRSLNFSSGGLCYKTDQLLEPMDEVCIVMDSYTPGRLGPEGYRSYLARIRWTRAIQALQGDLLAAGAQIIARSHAILLAGATEPRHLCDLCGALMPADSLFSIDSDAQLCELCYQQYQALPQRTSLARFMTGNVV